MLYCLELSDWTAKLHTRLCVVSSQLQRLPCPTGEFSTGHDQCHSPGKIKIEIPEFIILWNHNVSKRQCR